MATKFSNERSTAHTLRILPQYRDVAETYEPEVWKHLMDRVQPGDTVADVGAYIGLYSVALATGVGRFGKLVAFEPDPRNFATLEAHCTLNGLLSRVTLMRAAVGDRDGTISFDARGDSESHVSIAREDRSNIPCVRLDTVFPSGCLNILKIDVEGYEESVLEGGRVLLQGL